MVKTPSWADLFWKCVLGGGGGGWCFDKGPFGSPKCLPPEKWGIGEYFLVVCASK